MAGFIDSSIWELWRYDAAHHTGRLDGMEFLAVIQAPYCTGLFYVYNSNNRNAEPLVRALNCHNTLYLMMCHLEADLMNQTLTDEKRGRSTMPHTTTMRTQTEDIVIERTVQSLSMVFGTEDSTFLLPTRQEVKPKTAGQGGLSPQKY